jgi:diadenosine tetraphosphate (Ap4A) HIT family hydrolase
LSGNTPPPGGAVYENAHWLVCLRSRPLLVAGQGLIVLKRHCEALSDLSAAEAAALGPVMQRVQSAYQAVLSPERLYFGLYGEGIRHRHLHVTPRVAGMPAGNIPLTVLMAWYEFLARLGLRRPFNDALVAETAHKLRQAMEVQDKANPG